MLTLLGVLTFFGVLAGVVWAGRSAARRQEQPTDDSTFRHILALLATTRLMIAIRQATRP